MRVQLQGFRISGWKAFLAGLAALLVGAVVAVLSLAALGLGVMISVVARLVMGVRGLTGARRADSSVVFQEAPQGSGTLEVRDIQVDEVVVARDSR